MWATHTWVPVHVFHFFSNSLSLRVFSKYIFDGKTVKDKKTVLNFWNICKETVSWLCEFFRGVSYPGLTQTSKKECFATIVKGFHPLTVNEKLSLCYVMLCYVILCVLYLKTMHKIIYNKKTNKKKKLHSLQETKFDASLLLLLRQPTQTKFKQQQPQQQ